MFRNKTSVTDATMPVTKSIRFQGKKQYKKQVRIYRKHTKEIKKKSKLRVNQFGFF